MCTSGAWEYASHCASTTTTSHTLTRKLVVKRSMHMPHTFWMS
jgi:hypothetical protein